MKDVLVFTSLTETLSWFFQKSNIDIYKQLNHLTLLELCHSYIRHGWI